MWGWVRPVPFPGEKTSMKTPMKTLVFPPRQPPRCGEREKKIRLLALRSRVLRNRGRATVGTGAHRGEGIAGRGGEVSRG